MALPLMEEELNHVQGLSDKPNDQDGLSADQLKAVFDKGPNQLKDWLNNTFIPKLQSLGVEQIVQNKANVKYFRALEDGTLEYSADGETWLPVTGSGAGGTDWHTVTFIPYDGNVHTLSEGQVGELLPLPAEMDMINNNYEYEIIALGMAVTGATAYNTNLPGITLIKDTVKNRISFSLENTEEMEDGVIPSCSPFGYYLQQGVLSINQRMFWKSGAYWEAGAEREGFAVSKGYSNISEAYEYYNFIRLTSYAAETTTTYGLMFRYRAIPKE